MGQRAKLISRHNDGFLFRRRRTLSLSLLLTADISREGRVTVYEGLRANSKWREESPSQGVASRGIAARKARRVEEIGRIGVKSETGRNSSTLGNGFTALHAAISTRGRVHFYGFNARRENFTTVVVRRQARRLPS